MYRFRRKTSLPILPIDTGRYGSPEMRQIFDEENRLQKMLDVEAALAWAHSQVGNISEEDAENPSPSHQDRRSQKERLFR